MRVFATLNSRAATHSQTRPEPSQSVPAVSVDTLQGYVKKRPRKAARRLKMKGRISGGIRRAVAGVVGGLSHVPGGDLERL